MTEEQIKQNAEAYVKQLADMQGLYDSITLCIIKNAFITGAHSRDEEISLMQNALEIQARILREMERNIQKLRNPWISVEERLPEIGQKVITITNKGKLLLVARTTQPPHKEEGGWRWEHYVGKVTHWMQIPELKKGE